MCQHLNPLFCTIVLSLTYGIILASFSRSVSTNNMFVIKRFNTKILNNVIAIISVIGFISVSVVYLKWI